MNEGMNDLTINEFCLCQLLVTCHGTTGFMHAKPLKYIEKYYQLRKIFNNSIFFFQMKYVLCQYKLFY